MAVFFRRLIAFILSFFTCLSALFGGVSVAPWRNADETETVNDISGDTELADSVLLASALSNGVQCVYADAARTAYRMTNRDMTLTHTLGKRGNGATLTDADGNVYIADSFDAWCKDADGRLRYSSDSREKGRVNTIRLGEYYYDVHVRDYDLKPGAFKVDKEFHVWSDRIYLQYILFADEATTALDSFGVEIRIPEKTVAAVQIKDADDVHDDLNADPGSVEYAAFDIKNVGAVGFILPVSGETKSLEVKKDGGDYVVTLTADYIPGTGINKSDETGGYALNSVPCGCRIYTDGAHTFDGVENAARVERSPLAITADSGAPVAYEALRGCYAVSLPGTSFQYAYDNPDTRFPVTLSIPGADDRDIFIRAATEAGGLEACAVLDGNGVLVPIDVQVSKNFCGDVVEHYYSERDYSYGDAFFPVAVKSGKNLTLTAVHLYQNWGNAPLKQLSSIEFHVSYYHLSTGTTESNCIGPYGIEGKDGFLLPDFRGRSGVMWGGQPQFNACGKPSFLLDRSYLPQTVSEYMGSKINSVGPTHADIEMRFLSGDGSYVYTLRHVEFPQTDENRTYYTVDVEFLKDKAYLNFRGDMDLFFQTGRWLRFRSFGFLDGNNEDQIVPLDYGVTKKYHRLGDENPYYTLLTIDKPEEEILNSTFGANEATIVRGYSVTRGGENEKIPLAVREHAYNDFSDVSLTLDVGAITFMKGDTIHLDLILMPWGTGLETHCENVKKVREDSAVNRLSVEAQIGEAAADGIIPTVKSENNTAEFTVRGGGNNSVVKLDGFTRFGKLKIEEKTGDTWTPVGLASVWGYDGYGVHYNPDGTYCYSFVYASDGSARTFRATVE
ncbi:MAG: hypothetical protein IJL26_04870 [Clostridia bacterium]|nr:hypothetical protein [Clostridia bacterium]